jgi:hypothetical protein
MAPGIRLQSLGRPLKRASANTIPAASEPFCTQFSAYLRMRPAVTWSYRQGDGWTREQAQSLWTAFPLLDRETSRRFAKRSLALMARRFDLSRHAEGFDVRANHWQSQNVGLSYCRFQLDFPAASFFRQQISISGSSGLRIGRIEKQVTSEEGCVVPPETPIEVAFDPGYEQFVFRIEKHTLLNKLAALIGGTPSRKLIFERTTRVNGSGIANIRRL